MKRHLNVRTSEAGFSLIELAIVIVLVGLLAVPLMQEYNRYQITEKIDNTAIAISSLTSAIGDYYVSNGAYPCPSNRALPLNDEKHGRSDCSLVGGLGANTCNDGRGICHVSNADGNAFIGGVPYKDLNIPFVDTLDGFKNTISYVISQPYTVPAVEGVERKGTILLNNIVVDITTGEERTTPENEVHYMLLSSGQDGKGSFNLNGGYTACDASQADGENCDVDNVFASKGQFLSSDSASYYDDRVYYTKWSPTAIWMMSGDVEGVIYNTNPGTVSIGTSSPDANDAKLDVAGDIKAIDLQTQQLCTPDGQKCFSAVLIAGDAEAGDKVLRCKNEGEYMYAVAKGEALCRPMALNVRTGQCAPGKVMKGVDGSGNIICGDL